MPISYSNSSSSQPSVDPAYALGDGDFGIPTTCFCGNLMTLEASTNDANVGRRFYSCPDNDDGHIHIRKWWDDAIAEEIAYLRTELKHKADRHPGGFRLWGDYPTVQTPPPNPEMEAIRASLENTVADVARIMEEFEVKEFEMKMLKDLVASKSEGYFVLVFIILVAVVAYLLK